MNATPLDDPIYLPRTGRHYCVAQRDGGYHVFRMLDGQLHRFLTLHATERDARAAVARLCAMHGIPNTYEEG